MINCELLTYKVERKHTLRQAETIPNLHLSTKCCFCLSFIKTTWGGSQKTCYNLSIFNYYILACFYHGLNNKTNKKFLLL